MMMICAVVFSIGIVRDIRREELKYYQEAPMPYVVFPCDMTDREAYRFYAAHDPQVNGDYDPQREAR
jgi:hypothetical protein